MVLTDDGRILVSDPGRNAVVAVDATDGAFLGDLAKPGDQGYSGPNGVAVTRNGELLVACADDDVILAYDVDTGQFLGERVTAGSGGLDSPHAMILVPALLDRINNNPLRVMRPNVGAWYNPASDGRGFDIAVVGRRLGVIWYTYDQQGLPLWYIAAGDLDGFTFNGELERFSLDSEG